jgi:hypothetical protein
VTRGQSQTTVKATREDLIRENESLKGELERLRNNRLASNVTAVVLQLVHWAGVAVVGYIIYLAIGEVAGKVTHFDANVHADLSGQISESATAKLERCEAATPYVKGLLTLFFMMVFGCTWYVRRAGRLTKATIQRMSNYRRLYEELINPHRASSGLQQDGSTREEDSL